MKAWLFSIVMITILLLLSLLIFFHLSYSNSDSFYDLYPQWSPNGDKILFIRHYFKKEEVVFNSSHSGLFVLDCQNKKSEKINNIPPYCSACCWGKDNNTIIYEDKNKVFFADIKGNNKQLIFDFDSISDKIVLSSDKKNPPPKTLAIRNVFSNPKNFRLSPDKANLVLEVTVYTKLSSPLFCSNSCNPDLIMAREGTDIFLININDNGLKRITCWNNENESPVWSPDGTWILFVSKVTIEPEIVHKNIATPIYSFTSLSYYNIKQKNSIFFQHGSMPNINVSKPCWTSQGDVFYCEYPRNNRSRSRIYRLSFTGKKCITTPGFQDESPDCSPDGKHIVFSSNRNKKANGMRLFIMDIDGNNLRQISE